jgi:hypothetical protein
MDTMVVPNIVQPGIGLDFDFLIKTPNFIPKQTNMTAVKQKINTYVPMDVLYGGQHPEALEAVIKGYASDPHNMPIKRYVGLELGLLFRRRIESIRALAAANQMDTVGQFDRINLEATDERYMYLQENLKFAFRVIKRSVHDVELSSEPVFSDINSLGLLLDLMAKVSYREITSMLFFMLPEQEAEASIERFTASLHLDFAILASLYYIKHPDELSTSKLQELNDFLVDSVHRYGAYTRMMRPKKERRKWSAKADAGESQRAMAEWEAENKFLAESCLLDGMEEWVWDEETNA